MPETVVGASDTVSEQNKHRSLGIVEELWFLPPGRKVRREQIPLLSRLEGSYIEKVSSGSAGICQQIREGKL